MVVEERLLVPGSRVVEKFGDDEEFIVGKLGDGDPVEGHEGRGRCGHKVTLQQSVAHRYFVMWQKP